MQPLATPRMQQLQRMLEADPHDTFLLYGIALEHKKANNPRSAIEYLDKVIQLDPGYCYAYHQRGLVYESLDDLEAAQRSYRQGIDAARKEQDTHAQAEIEASLRMIE